MADFTEQILDEVVTLIQARAKARVAATGLSLEQCMVEGGKGAVLAAAIAVGTGLKLGPDVGLSKARDFMDGFKSEVQRARSTRN